MIYKMLTVKLYVAPHPTAPPKFYAKAYPLTDVDKAVLGGHDEFYGTGDTGDAALADCMNSLWKGATQPHAPAERIVTHEELRAELATPTIMDKVEMDGKLEPPSLLKEFSVKAWRMRRFESSETAAAATGNTADFEPGELHRYRVERITDRDAPIQQYRMTKIERP